MRRAARPAAAPYAALAPALRQVPSPASGFEAMPWVHAVATLLAGLFGLHARLGALRLGQRCRVTSCG